MSGSHYILIGKAASPPSLIEIWDNIVPKEKKGSKLYQDEISHKTLQTS
jgi:hypothetical protein